MILKILVVGGSLGLHSVDVILSGHGQSLSCDIYKVRDDDGHTDTASLDEFWRGGDEQK